MRDDEIDWDGIELDYRAGVLPLSAVAAKHGVSVSKLKGKASKFLWERKPLDPFAMKQAHGVASSPAKFGMDSVLSPPDLTQAAILTAASVIDVHRKDVKKLREMSNKFAEALADVFDILRDPANVGDAVNTYAAVITRLGGLIGEKSPADLLEQLSRVMVRLVAVERQAYGLDVMPNPDPGAEATDQKVQSQVNKLWEQIQTMQRDKTALH